MNDSGDFRHARSTGSCSSTWRGILQTRPILEKGLKWNIGKGTNVNFWKDWWVSDSPLANARLPNVLPSNDATVSNFLLDSGDWDLDALRAVLIPEKIE